MDSQTLVKGGRGKRKDCQHPDQDGSRVRTKSKVLMSVPETARYGSKFASIVLIV